MRACVEKRGTFSENLRMTHLVLVVDDDPDVLEVLAEMLEDLGCEVLSATGGSDALEKLSGRSSSRTSTCPVWMGMSWLTAPGASDPS
jgi:DNA-binding NtrC family response regulator